MGGNNFSKFQINKVLLEDCASRYVEIEERIHNLSESNIGKEGKAILEILAKGEIVFPCEEPSIFLQLIEKADQLRNCSYYIEIVKALLPSYKKSNTWKTEQLLTPFVVELKQLSCCTATQYFEKVASLIQILAPLDNGLKTSYLNALLNQRPLYWSERFIDILLGLVQNGANPAYSVNKKNKAAIDVLITQVCKVIFLYPALKTKVLHLLSEMTRVPTVSRSSMDEEGNTVLHKAVQAMPCRQCRDYVDGVEPFLLNNFPLILKKIMEKKCGLRNQRNNLQRSPLHSFLRYSLSCGFYINISHDHLYSNDQRAKKPMGSEVTFSRFNMHEPSYIVPNAYFKPTIPLLQLIYRIIRHLKTESNLDFQDEDGSTVVHELLNGMEIFNFVIFTKILNCVDTVIDVFSELLTPTNVNMVDKYSITPYSWILMWKQRLNCDDKTDFLKLERIFLDKGADVELALRGLKMLRGREIIFIFTLTQSWSEDDMVQLLEWTREVVKLGYPECLSCPFLKKHLELYVREHLCILNQESIRLSLEVLKILIHESNAQELYSALFKQFAEPGIKKDESWNYSTLFDVLCLCLGKGVIPSKEEVDKVMLLTIRECESSESLSHVVEIASKLIEAFRRHENTEVVKCHLNQLQNQYFVRKELCQQASEVIEAAYGTLDGCLKSDSAINIILFLASKKVLNYSKKEIGSTFKQVQALMDAEKDESLVTELTHCKIGTGQYEIRQLVINNTNWLQRTLLHLTVIYCHDDKVLQCMPQELIDGNIHKRDLHGCTPLHVAYLHQNEYAVNFLRSHGARDDLDYFGATPKSFHIKESFLNEIDAEYQALCSKILNTAEGVFETMQPMLIMPAKEREIMSEEFVKLFEMLIQSYEYYDRIEINIGGSLRERLKVGRLDEVDLQICFDAAKCSDGFFYSAISAELHAFLLRRMAKINWHGIPLRPVSVQRPWKFIWERPGRTYNITISVDVVPVFKGKLESSASHFQRQSDVIDPAQHHNMRGFLKWNDFLKAAYSLYKANFRYEWDILDSLPLGCRLGILITKALQEAWHQMKKSRADIFLKRPITSYVVKNALIWLLSGKLPDESYKDVFQGESEMERSYQRNKLRYNPNPPKWLDEEDLSLAIIEEGRYWAFRIVSTILKMAEMKEMTFGSYIDNDTSLSPISLCQKTQIRECCERFLNRLHPEVFYYVVRKGTHSNEHCTYTLILPHST